MKLSRNTMILMVVVAVLASVCLPGVAVADSTAAVSNCPLSVQASSFKGLYEHSGGSSTMSYSLLVDILKKKGNKVSFKTSLTYAYGEAGFYTATSRRATAKMKKGIGGFSFKTLAGDKGKGSIKLVSRKRVKIRLNTTKGGKERMPLTTGGNWKTLKRSKYQYHI